MYTSGEERGFSGGKNMNEDFFADIEKWEEEEAYYNKLVEIVLDMLLFEGLFQELPLPKILYEEKEVGSLGDFLITEIEDEGLLIPIYETYLYYYVDLKPLELKIGKGRLKRVLEGKLNRLINEIVDADVEVDELADLITISFKVDPGLFLFPENRDDIEKAIEVTIMETIETISTIASLVTEAIKPLTCEEKLRYVKPREEEIKEAVRKIRDKIWRKVKRKMISWKKEIERRRRRRKRMLRGEEYYDEACEHVRKGNFKLALECLEKASKLNPYYKTSPAYWSRKGHVLQQLGKHKEAIKCFDKRMKLDEQRNYYSPGVRYDKAISLIALGKLEEALELLEEILSRAFSTFGKYKQALLACYDLILKREPNNKEIQRKRRELLQTIQFTCPKCESDETEATEIREETKRYIINMRCKNCGHRWIKKQPKYINFKI